MRELGGDLLQRGAHHHAQCNRGGWAATLVEARVEASRQHREGQLEAQIQAALGVARAAMAASKDCCAELLSLVRLHSLRL